MCEVLDVLRGGYYEWLHRKLGKKADEESDKILKLMKQSYTECQGMCGLDKLLGDIREEFPKCSHNRAYKLQKANGFTEFARSISVFALPIQYMISPLRRTF